MVKSNRLEPWIYVAAIVILFMWMPIFGRVFKFILKGYWHVLYIFQYKPGSLMIINEMGMSRGTLIICLFSFFTFPFLWMLLKKASLDDENNPLLLLVAAAFFSLGAVYFIIVSCFCYNVVKPEGIVCHEFGTVKTYNWDEVSSVRLNCFDENHRRSRQNEVAYDLLMKDGRRINMYNAFDFDNKLKLVEESFLLNKRHIVERVEGRELRKYFSNKTITFINKNFTYD